VVGWDEDFLVVGGQLLACDGTALADLAHGVEGSDQQEGNKEQDDEHDEQVEHGWGHYGR